MVYNNPLGTPLTNNLKIQLCIHPNHRMSARSPKLFDATVPSSPSSILASNTALLLLDYQALAISTLGDVGTRAVQVARRIRHQALDRGVAVLHGVVDINATPAPTSRISERWPRYQARIGQDPSLGAEVPELLGAREASSGSGTERTFARKPGLVSALSAPGLREELEGRGVRALVVCGVSTSGCVLSTVRDATERGWVVCVVADACADAAPGVHDVLVQSVLPMTAHVLGSDDVWAMWGGVDDTKQESE